MPSTSSPLLRRFPPHRSWLSCPRRFFTRGPFLRPAGFCLATRFCRSSAGWSMTVLIRLSQGANVKGLMSLDAFHRCGFQRFRHFAIEEETMLTSLVTNPCYTLSKRGCVSSRVCMSVHILIAPPFRNLSCALVMWASASATHVSLPDMKVPTTACAPDPLDSLDTDSPYDSGTHCIRTLGIVHHRGDCRCEELPRRRWRQLP